MRKLIIILFVFVVGCNSSTIIFETTADFEIVDYNIYKEQYFVEVPIQFSNKSIYANSYFWDFGDGTQSVDSCPIHVYKTPGIYKVELTSKNKHSEDKKSINIEVLSDRFTLLTRVKRWRLIGKKKQGQIVELTSCDRGLRLSLTKDFEYIVESVDLSICDWSYKEKWYLGAGNIIYESAGIGSWYGHDFFLTNEILILKMPQQYEFIYEPE